MLYILRHATTQWNKENKLQGRTNIPLCEEGIAEAKEAAKKYADVNFDICYCSPLIRARQSADIILSGRDIPIKEDERLMEMSFGIYEGMEGYRSISESPIGVLFSHPERYKAVPEGESLEELFSRTKEFIDEMVMPDIDKGLDVLIVGHGAMNASIICNIKKQPKEKLWYSLMKNCELFTLL